MITYQSMIADLLAGRCQVAMDAGTRQRLELFAAEPDRLTIRPGVGVWAQAQVRCDYRTLGGYPKKGLTC